MGALRERKFRARKMILIRGDNIWNIFWLRGFGGGGKKTEIVTGFLYCQKSGQTFVEIF